MLVTPDMASDILGELPAMRSLVWPMIWEYVEQRPIGPRNCADELFLCGTGCQIWVRSVDRRTVSDERGPRHREQNGMKMRYTA